MRLKLVLFALVLLPLSLITMDSAAAPPPPAPNLAIVKIPDTGTIQIFDEAGWTITVTNTGNAPSGYLELTDVLRGADAAGWTITANTFSSGCSVNPLNNVLSCAGIVPARVYPLGQTTFPGIFLDGRAVVKVSGGTSSCGNILNVARMTMQLDEETTRYSSNAATIVVRGCETPTPSPTSTSVPPTSTPSPTAAVATATPVSTVVATFTPTPSRFAPGPPNTGTGTTRHDSNAPELWFAGIILMLSIPLIAFIVYRGVRR